MNTTGLEDGKTEQQCEGWANFYAPGAGAIAIIFDTHREAARSGGGAKENAGPQLVRVQPTESAADPSRLAAAFGLSRIAEHWMDRAKAAEAKLESLTGPVQDSEVAEAVASLESIDYGIGPKAASLIRRLHARETEAREWKRTARDVLRGPQMAIAYTGTGAKWVGLDAGANSDWLKQRDALLTTGPGEAE